MRFLKGIIRQFWHIFASLLGIAVLLSLVFVSWWYAKDKAFRLRWHITAKHQLVKGTRLTEKDIDWNLGRLSEELQFIPTKDFVIGKYTKTDLSEREVITPEQISEYAPSTVAQGNLVVPVEMKTEHAISLKPGMYLAFVQEKIMLPAVKTPAPKTPLKKTTAALKQPKPTLPKSVQGFLLLSVTPSLRDAAITTLTVEVPLEQIDSVAALATGEWRPVILNSQK